MIGGSKTLAQIPDQNGADDSKPCERVVQVFAAEDGTRGGGEGRGGAGDLNTKSIQRIALLERVHVAGGRIAQVEGLFRSMSFFQELKRGR
jgi:hypothetical protein